MEIMQEPRKVALQHGNCHPACRSLAVSWDCAREVQEERDSC